MSICSIPDCGRKTVAKDLCDRHYRNISRTGNPLGSTRRVERGAATRHPLYKMWHGMRVRCRDEKSRHFPNYGGRGISVCERWDDFWQFVDDMGPRPSEKHSLDRIDVNGNYEPGNVRWATPKEQAWNTRANVLSADDRERIVELTEFGLNKSQISRKLNRDYEAVRRFINGETYSEYVSDYRITHPAKPVDVSALKFKPVAPESCSFSECTELAYGHGLCRKHYRWQHESTTFSGSAVPSVRSCEQCGSELPKWARPDSRFCGIPCKGKWHRANDTRSKEQLIEARGACSAQGCDNHVQAKGLCRTHYMRSYHAEVKKPEDVQKDEIVRKFRVEKMAEIEASLDRSCEHCSIHFTATRQNARFCTSECAQANWRKLNPEKIKANRLKSESKGLSASRQQWLADNADRLKAYKREHYEANRPEYIQRATERNRVKRAQAKETKS